MFRPRFWPKIWCKTIYCSGRNKTFRPKEAVSAEIDCFGREQCFGWNFGFGRNFGFFRGALFRFRCFGQKSVSFDHYVKPLGIIFLSYRLVSPSVKGLKHDETAAEEVAHKSEEINSMYARARRRPSNKLRGLFPGGAFQQQNKFEIPSKISIPCLHSNSSINAREWDEKCNAHQIFFIIK